MLHSPLVGRRVARRGDREFVTGAARYIADHRSTPDLASCAHAVFVRSPEAHAALGDIDIEAARAMPGVLDVVTAKENDLFPAAPEFVGVPWSAFANPLLA